MEAKKWVVLFVTLLILSVSAIVIVTLTNSETSDSETTAPSQKEVVSIDDEALAALFAEADTILNTHTTITLNKNKYIQYYMRSNSMEASENANTEDAIPLNSGDYPEEDLQYLIFLSLITSRYEGYYVEVDTDYKAGFSRPYYPWLFLCAEYEEAGYSTIQEYFNAIRSGEASAPPGAYTIDFSNKGIRRYGGDILPPNLYPELSGAAAE